MKVQGKKSGIANQSGSKLLAWLIIKGNQGTSKEVGEKEGGRLAGSSGGRGKEGEGREQKGGKRQINYPWRDSEFLGTQKKAEEQRDKKDEEEEEGRGGEE